MTWQQASFLRSWCLLVLIVCFSFPFVLINWMRMQWNGLSLKLRIIYHSLWDEFPLGRNIFPDSDTRMMKTHKSLKLEVNGTFREEVRRPLIVRNGVVYWSCIQRSYVLKCERWEQSKLSYKRGMGGIVLGANVGEGLW